MVDSCHCRDFAFNKVSVKSFNGHNDEVNCAVLSVDLEIMVTGCDDHRLRLFNTVTRQLVTTLDGHTEALTAVAISPDSRYIASSSYDKTVRIWVTRQATCLHILTGHSKSVECLAFSQDSSLLCTGSFDKTAILWNVQDGRQMKTLCSHKGLVQSVAFSHDGGYLATGSWDYTICVWSVTSMMNEQPASDGVSVLHTLSGHKGNIRTVAFSSTGILASGSWDKTVRLWNPDSGRCLFVLEGHGGWIQAIAFSFDGLHIVSAADHDVLRIWDCTSGSCIQILDLGETDTVSQCTFGPKGVIVTSGSGVLRTAATAANPDSRIFS